MSFLESILKLQRSVRPHKTAQYGLPLPSGNMPPAQAASTAAEAFSILDSLTNIQITEFELNTPPSKPEVGSAYIIISGANSITTTIPSLSRGG